MEKNNIKSICVFCGSRSGHQKEYDSAARKLGQLIANTKIRLVYGGGGTGLMGAIASEAIKNGGEVLGVIPRHLLLKEAAKTDLKNLIITDNMHARKKRMYRESDAFIVLSGGVGTLDEFFEILTWVQLELHSKKIVILNTLNFWQPLTTLLDNQIKCGFIEKTIKQLFHIVESPEEALRIIHN